MERGSGRGGISRPGGKQQNRIYAFFGHQNLESSLDMVTSILSVSSINVHALVDSGFNLLYITPLVTGKCGKVPELLCQSFKVSMATGKYLVIRRVYEGCDVMIHDCYTLADLNELEIMEFDIIMSMTWLDSCYATVDCWKKVVCFNFPGEPTLEWWGGIAEPKRKFISYLKARKIIMKGCFYHLVQVQDVEVKPSTSQWVPTVSEFLHVFPDELLSIPPEREIEFAINVPPDT
ncbi:uncharacterized protein [Nicotiana tomentosiformis]|uniref:uncharacterized protein n=1 Tax=Nicotiana tomentosiformis TaxID=4098 RepID=UPI00388C5F1A